MELPQEAPTNRRRSILKSRNSLTSAEPTEEINIPPKSPPLVKRRVSFSSQQPQLKQFATNVMNTTQFEKSVYMDITNTTNVTMVEGDPMSTTTRFNDIMDTTHADVGNSMLDQTSFYDELMNELEEASRIHASTTITITEGDDENDETQHQQRSMDISMMDITMIDVDENSTNANVVPRDVTFVRRSLKEINELWNVKDTTNKIMVDMDMEDDDNGNSTQLPQSSSGKMNEFMDTTCISMDENKSMMKAGGENATFVRKSIKEINALWDTTELPNPINKTDVNGRDLEATDKHGTSGEQMSELSDVSTMNEQTTENFKDDGSYEESPTQQSETYFGNHQFQALDIPKPKPVFLPSSKQSCFGNFANPKTPRRPQRINPLAVAMQSVEVQTSPGVFGNIVENENPTNKVLIQKIPSTKIPHLTSANTKSKQDSNLTSNEISVEALRNKSTQEIIMEKMMCRSSKDSLACENPTKLLPNPNKSMAKIETLPKTTSIQKVQTSPGGNMVENPTTKVMPPLPPKILSSKIPHVKSSESTQNSNKESSHEKSMETLRSKSLQEMRTMETMMCKSSEDSLAKPFTPCENPTEFLRNKSMVELETLSNTTFIQKVQTSSSGVFGNMVENPTTKVVPPPPHKIPSSKIPHLKSSESTQNSNKESSHEKSMETLRTKSMHEDEMRTMENMMCKSSEDSLVKPFTPCENPTEVLRNKSMVELETLSNTTFIQKAQASPDKDGDGGINSPGYKGDQDEIGNGTLGFPGYGEKGDIGDVNISLPGPKGQIGESTSGLPGLAGYPGAPGLTLHGIELVNAMKKMELQFEERGGEFALFIKKYGVKFPSKWIQMMERKIEFGKSIHREIQKITQNQV